MNLNYNDIIYKEITDYIYYIKNICIYCNIDMVYPMNILF